MINLDDVEHHASIKEIVEVLCAKTQNTDQGFFRTEVAYFLAKMASTMRATIVTKDRGELPVNIYALALGSSGYGKGHSVNIMENDLISGFRKRFLEETMPIVAEDHIWDIANDRALRSGKDPQEEYDKANSEYSRAGAYAFTFDSGTAPAVKQLRHKLLLANSGAINLQIDECYTPDVEILTSNGFIRFDQLQGNEIVAQFDPENEGISFVKPIRFIQKEYEGDMYNFISPTGFDFSVTPNHEMLVWTKKKGYFKVKPDAVNTTCFLPSAGKATAQCSALTRETRLALAIQADGTIRPHGGVEFAFKKQRKMDELTKLLREMNISFSTWEGSQGHLHFYINAKNLEGIVLSKTLSEILPRIENISANYAEEVLDEVIKWDGSINKKLPNILRYTCKYKDNVDFIHTVAILAGYSPKVNSNNKAGYEGGYYVHWNQKATTKTGLLYLDKPATNGRTYRTKTHYAGTVHCVEVPSGSIVIRRNGISCIGGNCGSNLINNTEVLNVFLELYDQGLVKQKLTKNTSDSVRNEELDGKTPANMLLFGTPVKLLDGGQTEDQFYSFLETGYARRCIFGYGQLNKKALNTMTATEIYQKLLDPSNSATITKWQDIFTQLADPTLFGWRIAVEDDVAIELLEYKIACEKHADSMPDHEDIKKAELSHRYFKALKLAGAYAFVDKSMVITMDHLKQAILLVEESGSAFQTILNREKAYVKLAKYIAAIDTEVTHADLHEALPFYKSSAAARNELITLATAWGYKQHIIIKKSFVDGIEFFKGETLEETNQNEMILSYSDHWAYNYAPEKVPFDQLHLLTQAPGMHWCNHQFKGGHRAEENAHVGFNMIVLDIDEGASLATAHELLKEYRFMTYTTKRNSNEQNRFRIVMPINYILELDTDEYKEFMNNIMNWLPFKVDESVNQRAKKWESYDGGTYHYNDGTILDALSFIPKTSKNAEYIQQYQKVQSMDNLERWFAQRIATGSRNNQMLKFALALVDNGMSFMDVQNAVNAFNGKINNPLPVDELNSTIMITVAKRYHT